MEVKNQSIVGVLSAAVYNALIKEGVEVDYCELSPSIEREIKLAEGAEDVKKKIKAAVCDAYAEFIFPKKARVKVVEAAFAAFKLHNTEQIVSVDPDSTFGTTAQAFQQQYVEGADAFFRDHLARCCAAYYGSPSSYTSPYTTITQSSGFGKSRVLQRLAEFTAQGNTISSGGYEFDMKVLYVNLRDPVGSTGYPCATPALGNWLFHPFGDENSIKNKLADLFQYAIDHPSAASQQWLHLFSNPTINGQTLDTRLAEELSVRSASRTPDSRASKSPHFETSKTRTKTKVPVLVLAIDEARALLKVTDVNRINSFRMLRRALRMVFRSPVVNAVNGMVFAVLVDTSPIVPMVHDSTPALRYDPSSRGDPNTFLFPPFVLTQTMDVMMRLPSSPFHGTSSMDRVLETDPERVWLALVSLGRPLWHGISRGDSFDARKENLNRFASSKLLIGEAADEDKSYNDTTLHGVAALFCRAGLRPRERDPMASRMVADLMSVLHYVGYKNDMHLTNYSSDPILTFGASRIWYQLDPPALTTHLLPRFKSMLIEGMVDAGDIGELVARIFLLLAMDATMMRAEGVRTREEEQAFVFAGQFCDVPEFIRMLIGEDAVLCDGVSVVQKPDESSQDPDYHEQCEAWLQTWEGWKIGYSHFVDVPKLPTDDFLWRMLERRAAGIMPHNQSTRGADLLLPIFRDREVSFVLVQVKNRADHDSEFPHSALHCLSPSYVFDFDRAHPLHLTPVNKMIRLYMSLRERATDQFPNKCVLMPGVANTRKRTKTGASVRADDFALCVRGMFAPDAEQWGYSWSFLASPTMKELRTLANLAWWDGKTKVEADLNARYEDKAARMRLSSVLPREGAIETASVLFDLLPSREVDEGNEDKA